MERQRGLVVGRNEAQVVSVVLCVAKTEIAGMQPDEHGHAPRGLVDISAFGRRIDRNLLAIGPVGLPPGGRVGGSQRQEHRHEPGGKSPDRHDGRRFLHVRTPI